MRNLVLVLMLLLTTVAAEAQPVLTAASTNPVVGDEFRGHECDIAGVSKGASGPGVTWNFSSLVEINNDTTLYDPCTGTTYCDSFPGSNLSTHNYSGPYLSYSYFVTDAGKFAVTGNGVSFGCNYYSDPEAMMIYPMTYNTEVMDTFSNCRPSFSQYSYGVDTLTGDAYGTLILPTGTYPNVLRVHTVAITHDSSNYSGTPYVDSTRTDNYTWWAPGFHNPLVVMLYDTSASSTPSLSYVAYTTLPPIPTSVTGLGRSTEVQLYPNPAADNVSIKLNSPDNATVTIFATDIMGRTIGQTLKEILHPGANEVSYPVDALPSGLYTLHIQSGGYSVVKKMEVAR